jgi:hypothetical protein
MSDRRACGQALTESIVVGLLLLAPLIWALGVLAELHRSALAATAAAREAGFEAARSVSTGDAERAVADAVAQAFNDHGLDPAVARVSWSAASGLERGAPVAVEVAVPVPVVGAPFLGPLAPASVWVRARHVARVDPFRSRE